MPEIRQSPDQPTEVDADVVVVGAHVGPSGPHLTKEAEGIDQALDGGISRYLERMIFKNKIGRTASGFTGDESLSALIPTSGRIPAESVLVVGLGGQEGLDHTRIRKAAGVAARQVARFERVAVALPTGVLGGPRAAVEGFLLGGYRYERFLSEAAPDEVKRVTFLGEGTDDDLARGTVAAEATAWARDVVNLPAGARGPAGFVDLAKTRADDKGVAIEIYDEHALEDKGMNGILQVGRGSTNPPRLCVLTYDPPGAKSFVGVVGKGITFDSGGLSIKAHEGMMNMKTDCSGAAAVIAAITALPALGAKIRVKAAIPLAENMPSGDSVKPGDVIRHYGGRTSEVLNTDAEGRLVLADALAWMTEQNPDAMVDVATLTGGMMVALGYKVAGYFANRQQLVDEIREAGERTGERVWHMPLLDDYRADIDSEIADIRNMGQRYGAPIYGALFLKDFVGKTPWAHIDIAGPARSEREEYHLPIGATGFGTRLLIDWIEHRAGG